MSQITKNSMAVLSVEDAEGTASSGQKPISMMFKRNYSQNLVWCRRILMSILLLTVVILSLFLIRSYNRAASPKVCHSSECLRSAADLKHHMDLRVDPCEDFYGYVCGKWAEENPRDENGTHNSWSRERQLKIYRNIRDYLARNVSDVDPKPVGQAKIMYQACLNKTAREQEGFKAVAKYLQELGLPTIPTMLNLSETENAPSYQFDWIATVAKIKQKLDLDVLIAFHFDDHFNEGKGKKIRLSDIVTSYEFYDSEEHLAESLQKFVVAIAPFKWDDEKYKQEFRTLGKALVNLTYQFEEIYNETVYSDYDDAYPSNATEDYNYSNNSTGDYDYEDKSKYYYNVQELQNLTDSFIGPNKSYPIWEHYHSLGQTNHIRAGVAELNRFIHWAKQIISDLGTLPFIGPNKSYPIWEHYLEELFTPYPKAMPSFEEEIIWPWKDHLQRLVKLVYKQPLQVIELYIWERVVSHIVNHEFNKLKTEDECAKNVLALLGPAVNYALTDKNFLDVTKPRVEQMLNNIRDEFNQIVLETNWMDANSKDATLNKSRAMSSFIGLPEWYMDARKLEEHFKGDRYLENWLRVTEINTRNWLHTLLSNNSEFWRLDPSSVNANYYVVQNTLYLPVGIIQYPFFFLGLESLNYGALGMTLGHELTHGFDTFGRLFVNRGVDYSHWSNETTWQFKARTNCLVYQYSKFYLKEAKRHVNGYKTLDENIADNGGLREAFRAYQTYVKQHGPEPILPGFERISHEQLFFISFGNFHCGTLTPKRAMKSTDEDVHTPNEFRVTGVLQNMPEFSNAFQCPLGSPMNPARKCRVW